MFQNFGDEPQLGGTSLGPKTGTSVGWGVGDWQNFRQMGGPPVPPEKNPGIMWKADSHELTCFMVNIKIYMHANYPYIDTGIKIWQTVTQSNQIWFSQQWFEISIESYDYCDI